jgi:ATP-binding cassette subfamily B protein
MASQRQHSSAPTESLTGREWRAAASLLPYLWEYRWRVGLALAFLATAKVANVSVPLVMKGIVDDLDPKLAVVAVPVALLAIYGILRFSTTLFAELRDVVFVRVIQRCHPARGAKRVPASARPVLALSPGPADRRHDARHRAGHARHLVAPLVHALLDPACDPGVRAGRRCAARKFDWRFAAVTFGAVAIYITFTVLVTEWRMGIRRRANELDSKANTRAIDSLLNYETVKYFGNEEFEARRYDENLKSYEDLAVKQEASLGLLNIGQSLIIAAALTKLMFLAAEGVVASTFTMGDLVLINWPADPAVHPAQFSRHGLPRDQAVAAGHGSHVPAARGKPRGRGQARRARRAAGTATVEFRDVDFHYDPSARSSRASASRFPPASGSRSSATRDREIDPGAPAVPLL